MDNSRSRSVSVGPWLLDRHASGVGDGAGDARPGFDLSGCSTARGDLEIRSAGRGCGDDSVVGTQLLFGIYVRKTQYGPVYGGLAAAIGLMVWMEFSAMIAFLGAAWNAESAALDDSRKGLA